MRQIMCGTFYCDNFFPIFILALYCISIFIIMYLLYNKYQLIWQFYIKHPLYILSLILIIWFKSKYYICYCGDNIYILLYFITSILVTFTIPIIIVNISYGDKILEHLNKKYKKIKKKLKIKN